MPRDKKPEREKSRMGRRNRKFIRKDTASEYKSRTGMVEIAHVDGTSTYYRPSDLFMSTQHVAEPKMQPCHICGKETARIKADASGAEVPTCVMCGIDQA